MTHTLSNELPWTCVQLTELHFALKLTSLSLGFANWAAEVDIQHLSQLSALTNLGHLSLRKLPGGGVPGGLPSQLMKLSHLDLNYQTGYSNHEVAEQLLTLSSLTALQELSVQSDGLTAEALGGLSKSSQLTSLALHSPNLDNDTSSRVACLSALQSLDLSCHTMQPSALECLTQLQVLSLVYYNHPLEELLPAISKLSLLTGLYLQLRASAGSDAPPAAACTALTASTNLRSLAFRVLALFRLRKETTFRSVSCSDQVLTTLTLQNSGPWCNHAHGPDPAAVQLLPRSWKPGLWSVQGHHSYSPAPSVAIVSADKADSVRSACSSRGHHRCGSSADRPSQFATREPPRPDSAHAAAPHNIDRLGEAAVAILGKRHAPLCMTPHLQPGMPCHSCQR